jgi:hypothetical protein
VLARLLASDGLGDEVRVVLTHPSCLCCGRGVHLPLLVSGRPHSQCDIDIEHAVSDVGRHCELRVREVHRRAGHG